MMRQRLQTISATWRRGLASMTARRTRAIFFPGQGIERPGMLTPLAAACPSVVEQGIETLTSALAHERTELLPAGTAGVDTLVELLLDDAAEPGSDAAQQREALMHRTALAQPAILLSSILTLRCVDALAEGGGEAADGVRQSVVGAEYMLGHSLGQITAFVASGALTLADGLRIVRTRGLAMEAAVGDTDYSAAAGTTTRYGMLAIPVRGGAVVDEIVARVKDMTAAGDLLAPDEIVDVANVNSPAQVVLAGHVSGLEKVAAALRIRRTTRLPVRIPFHSRVLRSVEQRMRDAVAVAAVAYPAQAALVGNYSAAELHSTAAVRENIVCGCWLPVEWLRSVRFLAEERGVAEWTGIGPGSAVTAALVRASAGAGETQIRAVDPLERGESSLWSAVAGR
ncbi:acyl transferase/acyl hydrolase/lysophospholipase [Limtongia smithiae]|uniref:acyl transferase/acyl hydrolase/lysophospholipase n=1 Tax=Limtongia smithiae TaxID=1125753 RepID=UPI0034CDC89C